HARNVLRLLLAAWRQGTHRPLVLRSAALFCRPQCDLAGAAHGVRQLEQRLEAVLAVEPVGRVLDILGCLAALSSSAHLVQMFDSTVVRAYVSAAVTKRGKAAGRSAVRGAGSRPRSISRPILPACRSPSIGAAARPATAGNSRPCW